MRVIWKRRRTTAGGYQSMISVSRTRRVSLVIVLPLLFVCWTLHELQFSMENCLSKSQLDIFPSREQKVSLKSSNFGHVLHVKWLVSKDFVSMKYLFSDNVNNIFCFQLFEIYNTKFWLTRLEHYQGPYEKNEPYVVRSRYNWTNGVYVSV